MRVRFEKKTVRSTKTIDLIDKFFSFPHSGNFKHSSQAKFPYTGQILEYLSTGNPDICLFKVNSRKTCEICSKLTIKTQAERH